MWRFLRDEGPEDAPSAQAREVLDQAFRTFDPVERSLLARQALAIDPDCADAYVLLAENAPRPEVLGLYEQALAAATRTLDPELFRTEVGHFWGILDTRPYMRAREGLAHTLWTRGRRDECVAHLWEMLRLNPNDNQGVRHVLAKYLLLLDRNDDLERLHQQYPQERMAGWPYNVALLAFRREGDTPAARERLAEAKKANAHVPDYLLGRKPPPGEVDSYSPGAESEAAVYLNMGLSAWKDTPGAIAWLRSTDEKAQARAQPAPPGPRGFVKQWLTKHLPQVEDVWLVGFGQIASSLPLGGDLVRPWIILVLQPAEGLVLASLVHTEAPEAAHLWHALVKAMQEPAGGAGPPRRPVEVRVSADERWEQLRPHLEEVGVSVGFTEDQGAFDEALASLGERLAGPPEPALVEVAGFGPEQGADLFEAGAAYFRRRPWRRVGYEAGIRIACDHFRGGPWYAVIMGQSGVARGLVIYHDLAVLERMWGSGSDEEDAEPGPTSVVFVEEEELPLADVEAARRHGWEVAQADAWPFVRCKAGAGMLRPPLAWELGLLEVALRSVPDFLDRRPAQDDPAEEELTVAFRGEQVKVVLAWETSVQG